MESETKSRITVKKKGKGHDVFIDGNFDFWVIGSKAVAIAEANKELLK